MSLKIENQQLNEAKLANLDASSFGAYTLNANSMNNPNRVGFQDNEVSALKALNNNEMFANTTEGLGAFIDPAKVNKSWVG